MTNQSSPLDEEIMAALQAIIQLVVQRNSVREPFADFPDLLSAEDIVAMTRWSKSHVYEVMKRNDFPLANGREKPYCCFKRDFIDWLERKAP